MKCAWFALFLPFAACAVKRWRFSNDLLDPLNWEGGKPQACRGVIFPENLGSIASVFELYADEISLPVDGELEIREGGFVEFSENNPCLKIKPLKRRYWLSPSSWDYGGNVATPDAERVPCASDHVAFPEDKTIAVFFPETSVTVSSLEIGGANVSDEEWQRFLETDYGVQQFVRSPYGYQAHINVRATDCPSKGGCLCHYNEEEVFWVCENDDERREDVECLDPLKPIGHCSYICGGVLLLTTGTNFDLAKLKDNIPKHAQIDSYASKVLKEDTQVIQVVFVETQEYSELSTSLASDFFHTISKDLERFGVTSASLEVSGIALPKGSRWATAFSIIFGTLVGVLCILTILYVLYVGPLERYNFRVPLKEMSVGNWRPHLFARFENKEGGMSVATSLMSLEKAFDNPMYGTQRPSTSSEAVEVVVMEEPSTSQTEHENPSYDLKIEAIEEVEE